MKNIIDPITKKKYSIFSEEGKQILKKLVNNYQKGGIKDIPLSEEDKERQRTFMMIANRLNTRKDAENLKEQPVDSIRNLSRIQQNISEGIPDEYESLRIIFEENYDVILTMSANLHKSIGNNEAPHNLIDLDFFRDSELNNLKMNNITTIMTLTGKFLSEINTDATEENVNLWIMNDLIRNSQIKFYNFLKPLIDNNGDNIKRAIRILSIINFVGSKIEYLFPNIGIFSDF